jgi:ApaG protein
MSNQNHQIAVHVITEYLESRSSPERRQFAFAYHVTLVNQGLKTAKLVTRHWIIIDANQQKKEVRGAGVVGKSPLLKSGESFSYSSGVILETPVGTMQGSYQMVDDQGHTFDAQIAPFLLSVKNAVH